GRRSGGSPGAGASARRRKYRLAFTRSVGGDGSSRQHV
ncbi:MAG: hypothetical protein AVDCRST_MAG41-2632, partial [uncultured Corynebacteriales bacterium]